jgi:hypothetical protein
LEANYTKPTKPERPHVSPKGCSGCPTAWAYISSQASLSAVAGLLQTIGLDAALNGSFTGTLVLPTNDVRAVVALESIQTRQNYLLSPAQDMMQPAAPSDTSVYRHVTVLLLLLLLFLLLPSCRLWLHTLHKFRAT